MEEILRKLVQYQDREVREAAARNHYRLGRIVTNRSTPHGMTEAWEEGQAAKVSKRKTTLIGEVGLASSLNPSTPQQELQRQSAELLQRKDELEKRKKQIAKESRKAAAQANSSSGDSPDSTSADGLTPALDDLQVGRKEGRN